MSEYDHRLKESWRKFEPSILVQQVGLNFANAKDMSVIKVGISGWTYGGWRGVFYPEKLPHKEELKFVSRQLPTIEINGTFYSLQHPMTFQRWYDVTPKKFIFSVKGNRFITHLKRLNDIEIPLANFYSSGLLTLGEKLGPILWQFPPNMIFNPDQFEAFFKLLPKDFEEAKYLGKRNDLPKKLVKYSKKNFSLRNVIEIRNISFLNPWFIELLKKYKLALVFADTADKWPYMEDVTSDLIYIRLHGSKALDKNGYSIESLQFWKKRILMWSRGTTPSDSLTLIEDNPLKKKRDVFVYFDNDEKAHAPADAKKLISLLKEKK